MKNKKIDLVYLIVLAITVLAGIIHVTIDAVAIASNISTSAPWTVALLWFIPYCVLALIETAIWFILRRKK